MNYKNEAYCYPDICQFCGQKVIRYGNENGGKVVLEPFETRKDGGLHKDFCTGNNPYSESNKKNRWNVLDIQDLVEELENILD